MTREETGCPTQQTAGENYNELRAKCRAELSRLQRALVAHQAEQRKTPAKWTHNGDLGYALARLQEVADFLEG